MDSTLSASARNFKCLSPEHVVKLIAPFSHEEIDEAVASYDFSKALVPYVFNFAFIKSAWDLIKLYVYDIMHEFWMSSKLMLPRGYNNAHL